MASQFSYYRPRGIPGNYVIEIEFDLTQTQRVEVSVARHRDHHCGRCGVQRPVSVRVVPHKKRRNQQNFWMKVGCVIFDVPIIRCARIESYLIDDIMVEDSIRIVVFDDAVGSLTQMTTHLATREGFEHKIIPFENNGTVWKIVPLNPILLADLDISSDPFAVMCAPPKPDKRTTVREVEQEVQKVRLISSHNEGGK